jgi:hypothetical protein
VQEEEVRWKKGGIGPTEDYNFVYGKGNGSLPIRNGIFLHYIDSNISAIKWADVTGCHMRCSEVAGIIVVY